MRIQRIINFLLAAMLSLISGCASNSALTLLKASQKTESVIPGNEVIQNELKGRAFAVNKVYFALQAPLEIPAVLPKEDYPALIKQQVARAFMNAGLFDGNKPAYPVDIAIEQMKFTRGSFLIPTPSILRVRMEVRNPDDKVLMMGELESRYLPTTPVILPGIVGALPTAFKGQELAAFAKMIPAVAVVLTKVVQGLQHGKTLDDIEIYPETMAAGSLINPDMFLHNNPFGLKELTEDDVRALHDNN